MDSLLQGSICIFVIVKETKCHHYEEVGYLRKGEGSFVTILSFFKTFKLVVSPKG